jgi:gp16 family phage-associated protein
MNAPLRTLEQVRAAFDENGTSIRQWADDNKFPYQATLDVLSGRRKGRIGVGHNIAVTLGIKTGRVVILKRGGRKAGGK